MSSYRKHPYVVRITRDGKTISKFFLTPTPASALYWCLSWDKSVDSVLLQHWAPRRRHWHTSCSRHGDQPPNGAGIPG
jgi:hypothetical protein